MIGSKNDAGILFQTVYDIFNFIKATKEERDVTVWASYMEVYNE